MVFYFCTMKKENIIFGIYPILEAIQAKVVIDKIFIQKESSNTKLEEIVSKLDSENVSIHYVPSEKLNRLTRSNHQGVVAYVSPISFTSLEDLVEVSLKKTDYPLFIVLDQISDVRNFGAILRTAECTGVSGVIVQKKGGAPITGDTVKTSAGAIFNVPIAKVDHIKDAIFYLQGSEINVVAATEKTNTSIYDVNFKQPTAIVMGSEGKGVNKSVLQLVNEKAALPLLGEINSLNVSVACGALLYEAIRQQKY